MIDGEEKRQKVMKRNFVKNNLIFKCSNWKFKKEIHLSQPVMMPPHLK